MRYKLIVLALIAGLGACSTDEIEVYEAGRYLYFLNASDSINESFFFYPDAETINVDLLVRYAGRLIDEDMPYQLAVNEKLTTAQRGVDYEVDLEQVMPAMQNVDTIQVILKKTETLETAKLCLVLEIENNEEFLSGPLDSLQSPKIIFTSQAVRPIWWDEEIVESFLGEYSEAKYALFIEVTGVADMTDMSIVEKRIYSLRLKNYLIEQRNAGNPVMDDNVEMSVPVL